MNAVSVRGDWVGQVVDGRYPLIELLGGSGTGGTFLTEVDGSGSQKAAIKLLASSPQAEDRFAAWQAASKLHHPNLAKIARCGRTEIGEIAAVYVVTDLAEELLSEIIPERPLSADEARQLATPVLDVLGYLHEAGYVHGHLKPSNILVVENEIKLSSDALIPNGKPASDLLTNDIYVAPEVATGPVSPRADIWSFGVTLVEALSQEMPIWDAASDSAPVLPTSIPEPFAQIARECLQPDPSRRCTLADIRALLEGKPKVVATRPSHQQAQRHVQEERAADKRLPTRMPFLPLIIGFVLLVAVIIGLQIHSHSGARAPAPQEQAEQAEQAANAPTAAPQSAPTKSQAAPASQARIASDKAPPPPAKTSSSTQPAVSPNANGEVLSRDVPEVPRRASDTIHGTVAVAVRVSVNPDGSVGNAEYVTRGPSAYFARLALDSAHNWKFRPPETNGRAATSAWVLHYKFRRNGVEVTPAHVPAQ